MKDKKQQPKDMLSRYTDDEQRQLYCRACIAEFQQLGYQDQYLAQLSADLVPVLGINSEIEKP
ncbi:hypothetical protein [Pseudoalteromonas sp. H105]|jgi:hypothetical protein|uniref:hypothetical protein n=1 Tax=Pseudoalteromonas sp. H105 TaxID=1348393 RepID=UPI00073230CF|nr:hypothetical protein [Pseudoalteromonas sp. H105]KTF15658.1 hypothetical protein ATS75_09005 [Pseudoalteromonas sp. H105]